MIAVVALVVFFVFSSANHQREQALLLHDASQAAAVEQSTLSSVLSVLDTLATTTTISDGSTQAFQSQAQDLVHEPVSVALAKAYLSEYVVFAQVGDAFRVGQALNTGVFATMRPGGVGVVTGPIVSSGEQSTATFAVGPPLVPNGDAVFLQFTVNPYLATILPAGPALSDLRVALYGSSNPTRTNLVVATSSESPPWPGSVVSVPVTVGNETWTLLANARSPLIGTVATIAPLIILILGLLLALSVGVTVEVLVRRRRVASPEPGIQAKITAEPQEKLPVPPAPVPHPHGSLTQTSANLSDREQAPREGDPSNDEREVDQASIAGATSFADWRPDPFERAELRRFFLGRPTSLVRDGSTERYDPMTPTDQLPPPDPAGRQVESDDDQAVAQVPDPPVSSQHHDLPPSAPTPIPIEDEAAPPTEAQQELEKVAARVAETIAEELDELVAAASALNESLDEPDADTVGSSTDQTGTRLRSVAQPPPQFPWPTPPSPVLPPPAPPAPAKSATTPPPPPPPPPSPVLPPPAPPAPAKSATPPPPPSAPQTSRPSQGDSETETAGTGPVKTRDSVGTNGTSPTHPEGDPRTLLGTASTLWRRFRGDDRHS